MSKAKIIFILLVLGFLGLGLKTSLGRISLAEGSLVRTAGSQKVYVIVKDKKRWLPSPTAFNSYPGYKWKDIKIIDSAVLGQYPRVKHIKLANDSKVYYITEGGLKRHMPTSEAFLSYGNKWEDVAEVNQTELNAYPDSLLIRTIGDDKVYKIENGQKRWIKTAEVFNRLGYDWSKIAPVNQTELTAYFSGGPIVSAEPEQTRYPDTFIIQGPKPDSILETAKVAFKYSGTNPLGEKRDLTFETFLNGQDRTWSERGTSDSQIFNLPAEARTYTFYVRAKNKEGYTDPTPASLTFQIGVSLYYQKVSIGQVSPRQENFRNDYLILKNDSNEPINMSGWTIRSRKEELIIPQAINKVSAVFSAKDYSEIKLPASGQILISMGQSPSGVNFRMNKCAGYFDQTNKFFPSLAKECPLITQSDYSHLKKNCRDYISRLGRCEIPDYTKNWEISADGQCTAFLNEKFNYDYCFVKHSQETDFLKDEWRVFLDRANDFMDNDLDKLILRDKSGFLVNEFEY